MALFNRKTTAHIFSVAVWLCAWCVVPCPAQSPPSANTPPQIIRIVPGDGVILLAGVKVPIHISAYDAERETLEYRFSIGGAVVQPWSLSKTFYWQSSVSDTGAVGVLCEARDPRGGIGKKTVSFTVINPAAGEVLQKISDNYSRIRDFKADSVYYSTFNGKTFGDIQHCRYFFMAPDKEKIETFTDPSRTAKNEIIISNGPQVYLLDPQSKAREEVNLMESEGINPGEIDYLDIYYNQPRFLAGHSISRLDAETNFNTKVICLEVFPLQAAGLYSKLLLYVDYNKGILSRIKLFHDNALLQTIEVTETKQMPGKEWVPVKMTKIPAVSAGQLISTMAYGNIQVNPGLSQDEFDPDKQY